MQKSSPSPPSLSTKGEIFFQALHEAFLKAEQAAGISQTKASRIGELDIHLRFAGETLVPLLTPALEHLRIESSSDAGLTICVWDSTSTGVKLPPSPWKVDDYIARGEIWGFNNKRFNTVFQADVGILSMFDSQANLAVYWVRDPQKLRYYETASPLLIPLYWWLRRQGLQPVHAAAVGNSSGGVLMPGKGSSGKSTTSLACLHTELRFLGDNYVLLDQKSKSFGYSLYNSCALHVDNLRQRFPHLIPHVSNPERLDEEKALLFLQRYCPECLIHKIPLKAILTPKVTGKDATLIREASSAASFLALAPSSIFNLPTAGQDDFRNLARFVKQIPSYVLELGQDTSRIPDIILDFLHK